MSHNNVDDYTILIGKIINGKRLYTIINEVLGISAVDGKLFESADQAWDYYLQKAKKGEKDHAGG